MAGEFLPPAGFNTFEQQDKVLVGMSGGVDSSVTVRILQEQGFLVQGAVIRFSPLHDTAVEQAQTTGEQLHIPVHVIEAQDLFEQEVIDPFCRQYCEGVTPNPCVICNPNVKFRLLAEKADELHIPNIATGHYARVELCADGLCRIARAASTARDQSYMLYRLPQVMLERLILPLGEFDKEDIREMAQAQGLAAADRPDSMELCFVPDGEDYVNYIKSKGLHIGEGRFIGPDGADLGPHQGVAHYTVGQRKGLGIALGYPVFIREIAENGDIYLSEGSGLLAEQIVLTGMVTPDARPLPAGSYLVKIRSMAAPVPCRYDGNGVAIFDEPQRAAAPGQSAVFYSGELVAGGGFIQSAVHVDPE